VEQTTQAGSAPKTFGKYTLRQRIGAGGMAEVFLAIATGPEGFQRSLVIKRMLPHLSQDSAFVRMFIDEARVSALLSHPNLVQVFEFGKVDDSYFIAMEHVHGRTLLAMKNELEARQRQVPIAAAVEIVRQVCRGLDYAHSLQSMDGKPLGIVHRDISPPNVMVDCHGLVKILDFGIARVADEMREVRTQVGTTKGKVSYMSPEQLKLHDIDHRSDIFAVGIVLHELLTGRRLFRANNDYISSRLVLEADVPLPSSVNPAVPEALDKVVMHALERDRDLRYATAADMAAELEAVMSEAKMSSQEHLKVFGELFPNELAETRLTVSGSNHPFPNLADLHIEETPPIAGPQVLAEVATPVVAPSPAALAAERAPARNRRKVMALWAAAAAVALLVAIPLARRKKVDPSAAAPRPVAGEPAPGATTAAAPAPAAPSTPVAQGVALSIDSSPQDAEVTRVDSDQVLGRTPLRVTEPRSTQAIEFRIQLPGYAPTTYKIIPDLDKSVRVDLVRMAVAQTRPPVGKNANRAAIARKPAVPAHAPVAPAPAEAAAGGKCYMTVGTFPWARLWIDGKDSGYPTPVVHFPISCGPHKLRFKREDDEIDQVVDVKIMSGQEFKKNFKLEGDGDG
jgi:serine/threonine-protein kinase